MDTMQNQEKIKQICEQTTPLRTSVHESLRILDKLHMLWQNKYKP